LTSFFLKKTLYIENNAEGVLVYIGQISYIDTNLIDFRAEILRDGIDSVNVDLHYSFIRESPIFRQGKRKVDIVNTSIFWDNLAFAAKYYLYILIFYEDQNGNLYDTEHMEVYSFKKPEITGSYVTAAIDTAGPMHRRERYHYYDKNEREQLAIALEKIKCLTDHPIISYIRK